METKRFILVVSCITVFFTVLAVAYNFNSQPPFTTAGLFSARTSSVSPSSVDFDSLFAVRSSSAAGAVSKISSFVNAPGLEEKTHAAPASSSKAVVFPVNINTATQEELEAVPGIGPSLAQKIIGYRNEHGNFTSVKQIENIKGIGSGTRYAGISIYLSVG